MKEKGEIIALIRKFQSGWSLAEEKRKILGRIIELSAPLMEKAAARYLKKYPWFGKEDLIQEARFTVIKAAERFDFRKKSSFSTYAHYWIRVFLERYIAKNRLSISAPVSLVHVYSNRNKSGSRRELTRKYRIAEKYLERLREYEKIRVSALPLIIRIFCRKY